MTSFKDAADFTRLLLDACDALEHKRPPCDPVTGKALDREAFLAWRAECVAMALRARENRTRAMREGSLIASATDHANDL